MHIDAVEFVDFRSYQRLSFSPAPSLNILLGLNAQGKTNLLEGLAVLAVGRSFRGAKTCEMARWGTSRAAVLGTLNRYGSPRSLRRFLSPRESDGVWTMTGEGAEWARAIPFGWSDLAVVNGPPQARRNFVDGFVAKLYPSYAATLRRYREVLARRNHLLQTAGGAGIAARLEPWTDQLIEYGIEMTSRRRQGAHVLSAEAGQLYPALGGRGMVEVEYRSGLGAEPTSERFRSALEASLGQEVRRGQTLVGPHRDDVHLALDGHDLRMYGSRGQQRLMALTLRLAEARPVAEAVGSPPIVLLDDAMSELDSGVQERVMQHVSGIGQVFLTTADDSLPEVGRAQWWSVTGGTVREAEMAALRGVA